MNGNNGDNVITVGIHDSAFGISGCNVQVDWVKIGSTQIEMEGGKAAYDEGNYLELPRFRGRLSVRGLKRPEPVVRS